MDKQPAAAQTATTSKVDVIKRSVQLKANNKAKKLPKKIVSLKILEHRSLIEPEALDLYGDTCLHSTISALWNIHNIEFNRVSEKYGRYDAQFTRYTLHPDSIKAANDLIEYYEQKLKGAA